MPPDVLDFSRRAALTELMDEPCSREEMRACLRDIARVNRWFLGYRPTLRWLENLKLLQSGRPAHIVDIGCGYGDGLRRIEKWAADRQIPVELTGCDLNPDTVAIAAESPPKPSRIEWIAADVFGFRTAKPIDIVVSSLFTHHLTERQILRFLMWMENKAQIAGLSTTCRVPPFRTDCLRHSQNWQAYIRSCSTMARYPSRGLLLPRTGAGCAWQRV